MPTTGSNVEPINYSPLKYDEFWSTFTFTTTYSLGSITKLAKIMSQDWYKPVKPHAPVRAITPRCNFVARLYSSRQIKRTCFTNHIHLLDLSTSEDVIELFSLEGHTAEVISVAFSPDGKRLT